jgi:riboflavin kinase / FMN adenylyltransferase
MAGSSGTRARSSWHSIRMARYDALDGLQLPASSLAVGSFDGVHRGHQVLVNALVEAARRLEQPAVVLTFFPHPSVVLRGRRPSFYLMSPDEKADALSALGVDVVITLPFDQTLAHVRASDFLADLKRHLNFQGLWIGEDFTLGYQREGNRQFLEARRGTFGYSLHVVSPFLMEGEAVSSTRIREALRSGDVARAGSYLGRPFALPGKVIRGVGRGRRLGFPTANLAFWEERAYPGVGVYACWVHVRGQRFAAVTNIGLRPTFETDSQQPTIEAHLLDAAIDLYDREITLVFVERLRDERRFGSADALRDQIRRDIIRARAMLGPGDDGRA